MSAIDYILTEKGVKFDPGYGVCLGQGISNLDYVFSAFGSIPSPKQRKMQFMRLFPQIVSTVEQDVAFYLGCLLWASCIKTVPCSPIINNPCLGANTEDNSTEQIDFMIELVSNKLNRDAKYYINKTYTAPESYVKILAAYKEFLVGNNGFVETKNTDDVFLPSSVKKLDDKTTEKIVEGIKNAIETKNIKSLFDFAELIF